MIHVVFGGALSTGMVSGYVTCLVRDMRCLMAGWLGAGHGARIRAVVCAYEERTRTL